MNGFRALDLNKKGRAYQQSGPRQCLECRDAFEAHSGNQVYCSRACQSVAGTRRRPPKSSPTQKVGAFLPALGPPQCQCGTPFEYATDFYGVSLEACPRCGTGHTLAIRRATTIGDAQGVPESDHKRTISRPYGWPMNPLALGVRVQPLRNMVLLRPVESPQASPLVVIEPKRAMCRFIVLACGPEVRDVKPDDLVLANRLAATQLGDEYLLPESAILGTL